MPISSLTSLFKSLHRRFTTLPDSMPKSYLQLYIFLNYGSMAGVAGALAFAGVYVFLGLWWILPFSAVFIACYSAIPVLNIRGRINASLWMVSVVHPLYSAFVTYAVGWETGCQIFIIMPIMVLFFATFLRLRTQILM